MHKKILIILGLMGGCVITITGLQLYWNYQNYHTTVSNFKNDSKNALTIAIDKEIAARREKMILKVKDWLADTTLLRIECHVEERDSNTVFTMQDVNPRFKEDLGRKTKFFNIGISDYKEKVERITPKAKEVFINHFAERTFRDDLVNGIIYYYTQGLGDSIAKAYEGSKFNPKKFTELYQSELAKRKVLSSFKLVQSLNNKSDGLVLSANTELRRPYKVELIYVSIENPSSYYFREMRGLLIISLLLISATIFCFYYTITTLLSQQKLVAIKNQFISNMTHEINTPLASIQVTAEALKQFTHDQSKKEKYLDIILYQTKKLHGLSEEILTNARLETIGFNIIEEINLNSLISTVIKELNLEDRLVYHFNEIIIAKANQKHLSRAIANILENAFKYSNNDSPNIEIRLSKKNNKIKINISDDGPGVADEFKEKIFDQFFRVPTGNLHNIKGYGLGLSYVKKVISQHKGTIQVFDNQQNGSVFSIILPA